MIAEISQLMLALALACCAVMAPSLAWSLHRGHRDEESLRRALAGLSHWVLLLVGLAFAGLAFSFITTDFSVRNVAENANRQLPLPFRFAATWGSHEGSFLLWVLMLAGWTAAVALASRGSNADPTPGALGPRAWGLVLAVLLVLQAAFLAYLLTASNPFERILPAPADGRDLNPLLQDVFMVIHPPMLYMGYVGFAVCFALAVAALALGRLDADWARRCRPWANAAWAFLTVGILLGSWWAYRELGWGGWWFWDPVENASLMPWLAGAALVHSLAVTDRRGALRSWTVLLAIICFGLSLMGTFLVRSGVLTSVHAFAADPSRGVFILIMLAVIMGLALALYGWRSADVGLGATFSAVSRESLLLFNNGLMAASLGVVMLGTLYPLVAEVVGGRKLSVGPPYFEAVLAPLLVPAVVLMAAAPWMTWKQTPLGPALRQIAPAAALAAVLALALTLGLYALQRPLGWLGALGVAAALVLALATLAHVHQQLRRLQQAARTARAVDRISLPARVRLLGASYWAMVIAHLGVAVFTAGVSMVKSLEQERDVAMRPGQTESLGPWRVTFVGVDAVRGVNYEAAHGVFELTRGDGTLIRLLEPQKRRYSSQSQVMTEAAVHYGFWGDVYLSLGEALDAARTPAGAPLPDAAWSVRLHLKPMMAWVWVGCLMMALGAAWPLLWRRGRR